MSTTPQSRWPVWLLVLVTLLSIAGGTAAVIDSDDNGSPSVTIHVDGKDKDRKADDTVRVPIDAPGALPGPQAAAQVKEAGNLRDESPPGVPDAALDAAREQQEGLAHDDNLPIVQPDAAPSQRGCSSRFVRNYSTRRGVKPRLWVAHYTVSGNLPGIADLLGLTALANRGSSKVSWTYNIDRDGNCFYTVRESDKPWTQATFNSVSIGTEFVNTGREFPFLKPAGFAKAGIVISDSTKRWGIPLRLGVVNTRTCTVTRAGIVDHHMLGPCGGGHFDIQPPFSVQSLITAARKARGALGAPARLPSTLNATQRHTCDVLNFHRARAHKVGRWFPSRARRAAELKAKLPKGTCPSRYRH